MKKKERKRIKKEAETIEKTKDKLFGEMVHSIAIAVLSFVQDDCKTCKGIEQDEGQYEPCNKDIEAIKQCAKGILTNIYYYIKMILKDMEK